MSIKRHYDAYSFVVTPANPIFTMKIKSKLTIKQLTSMSLKDEDVCCQISDRRNHGRTADGRLGAVLHVICPSIKKDKLM